MPSTPLGIIRRALAAVVTACAVAGPLGPSTLGAQDEAPPASVRASVPSLTLAEVHAMVDRRNPRVAAAAAGARAAAARIAESTRPMDPALQFGLMNYMLPGLRADPVLGMRQVQLMQMVPLPGRLAAAGDVARARATSAGARAAEVAWESRATAAMAFYDRMEAQRQLVVARETRRLLEDVAAVAAAMYRVGDGRQADVLRARVEVARMDAEVQELLARDEGAVARLAAAVDLPPDSVRAVPAPPRLPDTLPRHADLEALALASRPMLASGEAEVEAAVAGQRVAARALWPDLQVGVQYGERSTPMGTDRMGSLMLGASLPIWARARQLAMRDEAVAMRAMAEADLAWMRAVTRSRVGEVHAELAGVRALDALYRGSILPQAEAAAEAALTSYRAGAVDFMTVIENRMTVNRYRMELAALDAAQGRAWAELEMLTGRSLVAAGANGARDGGR